MRDRNVLNLLTEASAARLKQPEDPEVIRETPSGHEILRSAVFMHERLQEMWERKDFCRILSHFLPCFIKISGC